MPVKFDKNRIVQTTQNFLSKKKKKKKKKNRFFFFFLIYFYLGLFITIFDKELTPF